MKQQGRLPRQLGDSELAAMDDRYEFLVSTISALCGAPDRERLLDLLRASNDARAFLDDFR